jgi:hypothetical protein
VQKLKEGAKVKVGATRSATAPVNASNQK